MSWVCDEEKGTSEQHTQQRVSEQNVACMHRREETLVEEDMELKAILLEIRAIRKGQDELKRTLKETIDAKINSLRQGELKEMREELNEVQKQVKSIQEERRDGSRPAGEGVAVSIPRVLQYRMLDQEARLRRNNLLFYNIEEEEEESPMDKLRDFLRMKLDINTQPAIQRVHRLGRKIGSQQSHRPRPIIVSFRDYPDIENILGRTRKLAGTRYGIMQSRLPS